MTIFSEAAPAKLNLALHVRNRRRDGFHELETLFAFTCFGDRLTMVAAGAWDLTVSGPMAGGIETGGDNLVLRAARAFAAATDMPDRYAFALDKHIPVAAGLGGGSADAAAALRLLARASGYAGDLEAIGARIGADVAACVRSTTCHGSGKGEKLQPGPALGGTPVLLVNPRVPVPTGEVFANWDGEDRGPLGCWRNGRNDLEAPAIRLRPVIAEVLTWLRSLPDVRLARMSGSGATCFALFADKVPESTPPAPWWTASTTLL